MGERHILRLREGVRGEGERDEGERHERKNQCCVHQGHNVMAFFLPRGIMEGRSVLLQKSPSLMEGWMDR